LFLLIPLILIVISAGGVLFIIWRKLPRLEKLAEAESVNRASFRGERSDKDSAKTGILSETQSRVYAESGWCHVFFDLCPEIRNWAKNIKAKEYKEMWLIETEKLLRRLRVASLKMDRFSDSLITKIRKQTHSGGNSAFSVEEIKNQQDTKAEDGKVEFKKNEQRLIIEIAKNPKNAALYEELGDLYSGAGDYKDAKESYEAAIELNSNSEGLKKKLSQILEKLDPVKSQNDYGAGKSDGSQN